MICGDEHILTGASKFSQGLPFYKGFPSTPREPHVRAHESTYRIGPFHNGMLNFCTAQRRDFISSENLIPFSDDQCPTSRQRAAEAASRDRLHNGIRNIGNELTSFVE